MRHTSRVHWIGSAVATFADFFLGLPGPLALLLVFALPAAEASLFIGFVFPGEVAVILGGVLANQGRLSLPLVITAAVAGAIAGDAVGYWVGRRWGERLLNRTVGRFVKQEHLDQARAYLSRRGGRAVFLGRFTASLRALVPGLAGLSGMPYRTFATWNVIGGAIWAATFVIAGYLAGSAWKQVEGAAGRAGFAALGLVIVAVVVMSLRRRRSSRSALPDAEAEVRAEA